MKAVIIIENRVVQEVLTDNEKMEVVVVDRDTEGLDCEIIQEIENDEVYIYEEIQESEQNENRVNRIFKEAGRSESF